MNLQDSEGVQIKSFEFRLESSVLGLRWRLTQAFFSTEPKKLKDEKTQNSKKKLKTQAKNSRIRQILVKFTAKINANDQKTREKLLKN